MVRIGFSNTYRGVSDEAALLRLAGEHSERFFKQSFDLKIQGRLDSRSRVEPLQALFAHHGASTALNAKAVVMPAKEFHVSRNTLFSPQQNV